MIEPEKGWQISYTFSSKLNELVVTFWRIWEYQRVVWLISDVCHRVRVRERWRSGLVFTGSELDHLTHLPPYVCDLLFLLNLGHLSGLFIVEVFAILFFKLLFKKSSHIENCFLRLVSWSGMKILWQEFLRCDCKLKDGNWHF